MDRELRQLHRGAREEQRRLVPAPAPPAGEHIDAQADTYRCHLCGERWEDRGSRLLCCSDGTTTAFEGDR